MKKLLTISLLVTLTNFDANAEKRKRDDTKSDESTKKTRILTPEEVGAAVRAARAKRTARAASSAANTTEATPAGASAPAAASVPSAGSHHPVRPAPSAAAAAAAASIPHERGSDSWAGAPGGPDTEEGDNKGEDKNHQAAADIKDAHEKIQKAKSLRPFFEAIENFQLLITQYCDNDSLKETLKTVVHNIAVKIGSFVFESRAQVDRLLATLNHMTDTLGMEKIVLPTEIIPDTRDDKEIARRFQEEIDAQDARNIAGKEAGPGAGLPRVHAGGAAAGGAAGMAAVGPGVVHDLDLDRAIALSLAETEQYGATATPATAGGGAGGARGTTTTPAKKPDVNPSANQSKSRCVIS